MAVTPCRTIVSPIEIAPQGRHRRLAQQDDCVSESRVGVSGDMPFAHVLAEFPGVIHPTSSEIRQPKRAILR
ncbi:unnamed protein product [Nezara viridula]|uniref:Uncharacterized protein n=1 Tax=Nezara viridula TaxID=85310 RepID=A0A9P0E8Z2_NEZVI|nr:unnamed protein product [Nezara viridula]